MRWGVYGADPNGSSSSIPSSKDARSRPPLVGPVDLVMSTVLLLDYRKGLAIPKPARVLYIHTVMKIELVKRLHRHYLCKLRLRPLRSLKMCLLAESWNPSCCPVPNTPSRRYLRPAAECGEGQKRLMAFRSHRSACIILPPSGHSPGAGRAKWYWSLRKIVYH